MIKREAVTNNIVDDLNSRNENWDKLETMSNQFQSIVDGEIQAVLDSEIVHTEIENKLLEKETEYAPRLTNVESQLATKASKDEVTNVMTPKGNIAYTSLPSTGNTVGWYYYCPDGDGTHGAGNYVWNGTSWYFGGTGDQGYNILKDDLADVTFDKEKVVSSYKAKLTGGLFQLVTGVKCYVSLEAKPIKRVVLYTSGLSNAQDAYSFYIDKFIKSTGTKTDGTYEDITFDLDGYIPTDTNCFIRFRCANQSISVNKTLDNNTDICISDTEHPNKSISNTGVEYNVSPSTAFYPQFDIVYDDGKALKIDDNSITPSKMILGFDYDYKLLEFDFGLFNGICACGDSFTQGMSGNKSDQYKQATSWFNMLMKKYGLEYLNCGIGGASTRTWLTLENGLPRVLSSDNYDLYLLAFGSNDVGLYGNGGIGTIADIHEDYTQNADTFYGNYGKIISQLMNKNPNARLVMFKIWYMNTGAIPPFNVAITSIANHFGIPLINPFDDYFFNSDIYKSMPKSHPSPLSYNGMSKAIERLFNKCISENINYFKFACIDTPS